MSASKTFTKFSDLPSDIDSHNDSFPLKYVRNICEVVDSLNEIDPSYSYSYSLHAWVDDHPSVDSFTLRISKEGILSGALHTAMFNESMDCALPDEFQCHWPDVDGVLIHIWVD